jgi:hypothetical protein
MLLMGERGRRAKSSSLRVKQQRLRHPLSAQVIKRLQKASRESRGDMQDRDITSLSIAQRIIELERNLAALLESESTRRIVMQLQQSSSNLLSIQLHLHLRVKWTPDQLARQQERLERQQARLQWQQAMVKQLEDK